MQPDLFKAAVAGVPFVDVVTTMIDLAIPLTTAEWEEWGDPRKEEFYFYMKSYSPVDNVKAHNYPAILVTAGYTMSWQEEWHTVCLLIAELLTIANSESVTVNHKSTTEEYDKKGPGGIGTAVSFSDDNDDIIELTSLKSTAKGKKGTLSQFKSARKVTQVT